MARSRRAEATALAGWVKPQLTRQVDAPPDGPEWLHEIKFDGYRMHARLDRGSTGRVNTRRLPPGSQVTLRWRKAGSNRVCVRDPDWRANTSDCPGRPGVEIAFG